MFICNLFFFNLAKKNHPKNGKGSNTQQNDGSFAGTVTLLGRIRQSAEEVEGFQQIHKSLFWIWNSCQKTCHDVLLKKMFKMPLTESKQAFSVEDPIIY